MNMVEEWLLEDPCRFVRASRKGWEGEPSPFLAQRFKDNVEYYEEYRIETLGTGNTMEEAVLKAIGAAIK